MEQYGWTLTEVRKQPYVKLLEILNEENKEETEEKQSEQKVITGTDLENFLEARKEVNMNEKVEGMTLELKLDHLGVQEGMKGLKRQLGVVNSEMKANLSAFDKSEKSMEKYQARIKGLNDRLKVQKKMYSQVEDEA